MRQFKPFFFSILAWIMLAGSQTALAGILIVHDQQQDTKIAPIVSQKILSAMKSRFSRSGFLVHDEASLKLPPNALSLSKQAFLKKSDRLAIEDPALKIIFVQMSIDLNELDNAIISYVLSADIYSASGQSFVSSWSLPIQRIGIDKGCTDKCMDNFISQEMSRDSEALSKSLIQLLSAPSAHQSASGEPIITYKIEFLDLSEGEQLQLVDLMRNEFPGFVEIKAMRSKGPRHQFNYVTTATTDKMREWLVISLSEIGLDPDTDIELILSDGRIDIRRYLPSSALRPERQKNTRFQ